MKKEPTNRELINYLIKGSKDLIPKGKITSTDMEKLIYINL